MLVPAASADLATLQELAHRTVDACYRPFLGDAAVDAYLGSGAAASHVAAAVDAGTCHLLRVDGEAAALAILEGDTVDLMMVDPRRHRRGLGRAVLTASERLLFAAHPRLRLESFVENRAANAFYRACGWSAGPPMDGDGPARVEFVRFRAR